MEIIEIIKNLQIVTDNTMNWLNNWHVSHYINHALFTIEKYIFSTVKPVLKGHLIFQPKLPVKLEFIFMVLNMSTNKMVEQIPLGALAQIGDCSRGVLLYMCI